MARILFSSLVLLFAVLALTACGDTGIPMDPEPEPTTPAPRSAPRTPVTPWGGAIMGLRIGIDPAKKEFAQGEDLIFTIRAENVLKESFKVPRFADGAWGYYLSFQNSDTDKNYTSRGPDLDSTPTNDVVLQPGELWSMEINLTKNGRIKAARGGAVDSLPPGLYEVIGGYTNHKGEGYWIGGHCWSNAVTIRIR